MTWLFFRLLGFLGLIWSLTLFFFTLGSWSEYLVLIFVILVLIFSNGKNWFKQDESEYLPAGRIFSYVIGISSLIHSSLFIWYLNHNNSYTWILLVLLSILIWTIDIAYSRIDKIVWSSISLLSISSLLIIAINLSTNWQNGINLFSEDNYLSILFFILAIVIGIVGIRKTIFSSFWYSFTILFTLASVFFVLHLSSVLPLITGVIIAYWWYALVSAGPYFGPRWRRKVVYGLILTLITLIINPWL